MSNTNGLCSGHPDPDLWFSLSAAETEEAKAICGRCPIQAACLKRALEDGIQYGVWGGLTEDERRAVRKGRAVRKSREPRRKYVYSNPDVIPAPSDVRGVSWSVDKGRWVVLLRHNSKLHWVGVFTERERAEEAAIAKCAELGTTTRRLHSGGSKKREAA